MASDLEQVFGEYQTDNLLEQYFNHREEYGAEALEVMKQEIDRRGVGDEELAPYREEQAERKAEDEEPPSFVPFDHSFSQTDILLANAVLKEAGVAYYLDNPVSKALPLNNEADVRYTIHVLESKAEEAHALLDEHFHREEGQYRLKHTSVKDRLRAFSFYEVHLTEAQMAQEVTVSLSTEERTAIAKYSTRLVDEADEVEKAQERTIFYYDSLEDVIAFVGDEAGKATMQELVAVLEVLQVYCDEESFPNSLLATAEALLGVFED